jgi:DNA-binding NarL/FixJ family response regulator
MLSPLGGEGAWMDRRRFLVGVAAGLLAGIAGGLFAGATGRASTAAAVQGLLSRLSPRERQVLTLRARGWSDAQIGRALLISPFAVGVFTRNALQKLEMHSRLEAAVRHGT